MSRKSLSNAPASRAVLVTSLSGVFRGLADLTRIITPLFIILMLVVVLVVLLLRNGLGLSPAGLEELKLYAQAYLVMLSLSAVQAHNQHVRVDIFYQRFSPLQRNWTDLLGTVLLALPFSLFILWTSANYAGLSLAIREASDNPGGLPFLYLMKAALPLGGLLLCLQVLTDLARLLVAVSFVDDAEDEPCEARS